MEPPRQKHNPNATSAAPRRTSPARSACRSSCRSLHPGIPALAQRQRPSQRVPGSAPAFPGLASPRRNSGTRAQSAKIRRREIWTENPARAEPPEQATIEQRPVPPAEQRWIARSYHLFKNIRSFETIGADVPSTSVQSGKQKAKKPIRAVRSRKNGEGRILIHQVCQKNEFLQARRAHIALDASTARCHSKIC